MSDLNALPGPNGNTADHFRSVYHKLNKAIIETELALYAVQSDVTHGRNYQHLSGEEAGDARNEDLKTLDDLRGGIAAMMKFQSGIVAALRD